MNKLAKHDCVKLWTYQVSIVSDTGECWRCFRTEKEKLQLLWPQLGSPSTCRQLITNRSDWKVSKLCTGRASTGTASTGRASTSKQAQAQAAAQDSHFFHRRCIISLGSCNIANIPTTSFLRTIPISIGWVTIAPLNFKVNAYIQTHTNTYKYRAIYKYRWI